MAPTALSSRAQARDLTHSDGVTHFSLCNNRGAREIPRRLRSLGMTARGVEGSQPLKTRSKLLRGRCVLCARFFSVTRYSLVVQERAQGLHILHILPQIFLF